MKSVLFIISVLFLSGCAATKSSQDMRGMMRPESNPDKINCPDAAVSGTKPVVSAVCSSKN